MQLTNLIENITPQSPLLDEQAQGYITPDQMIQLASAKLEFLKALYRQQLGFDLVLEKVSLA
ncbi:hypothetical protein [Rufibacter latericius]|uniref:Uncharacterized protein n=1 Tax=Rufibacter latericius TaxID=2487040 RepID=A0A3M9N294_9BACT|nr:hypothetical protein [Rufibacter latericius]RNI31447.1 hypothetical protein EFB08_02685 [Rufibacter latericius]